VLKPLLDAFRMPVPAEQLAAPLQRWAEVLAPPKGDSLNERELLPDFLTDVFCGVLGYARIVDRPDRFTFSREKHVEVDGKWADAVLGEFRPPSERFVIAVEGKGPTDPLERPFAGRKMSAVDQGYRYAINLRCDWIIVTSMRQTRLYHKGSDQHTYERFDIDAIANDEAVLKKLVFLLGAQRVVPETGKCHFEELLAISERVGRELTKKFYLQYAEMREIAFDRLRTVNASVPPATVLFATQKLLDRILFCCFAQNRGLLPVESVQKAYQHADPYNPRPIFDNFRGLFRSINVGNEVLRIPAYNGGLFADDTLLDGLSVPDEVCGYFQDLAGYDYRPGHEIKVTDGPRETGQPVDVDILGHIFEQSITDLERLKDEIEGRAVPETSAARASRRKREGAFYTHAFVTRYIVSQALGGVLADAFERLRQRHASSAEGTARSALVNPAAYDAKAINRPQRTALTSFWEEWQDELARIRVLDPACGSGAFLIQAFDQLHAAYEQSNDRLQELRGHRSLFDLDRQILQNNLFGVDLNEEAIQICRLSLWIKTAERGKILTSLDETIRPGNSIVGDPAVDARAFQWPTLFQGVFERGGFDVVVGNPPYVRQEWISPLKPYLQENYRAFHGMADLYVYFYELGLRLLRPGGRLGFVVTNKWMRSGYGEPLRRLLASDSWVESVVDFGHAKQIFPDADVFPSILVAKKPDPAGPAPETTRVCVIPRDLLRLEDLSQQIRDTGFSVPRQRLGTESWSLESPAADDLLQKLQRVAVPLREFAARRPLFGIKTGLNEAFLIDTPTKNALVASDAGSTQLLRRYVRGQDIDRWQAEWAGFWMIALKSSGDHDWPWADAGDQAQAVFAQTYPAIYRHLMKYHDALIKRQDQGRYWWELRACAYWDKFDSPKLFYQDITWQPQVCYDASGTLCNNTVYFVPSDDLWVMAVMNAPIGWWYAWRKAQHGKDEALRYYTEFVETFPIPRPTPQQRQIAEDAIRRLIAIKDQEQQGKASLFDWLRVEYEIEKPNQKLQMPTRLEQDAFVAEVRKLRGRAKPLSPVALRALRDGYTQTVGPLRELEPEMLILEQQLDRIVNEAFGLSAAEVRLMWDSAPPRTPTRTEQGVA
jgi:methylase of polypeptide subunit release factors